VLLPPSLGGLAEGDPFLGFLLRLPERTRREGRFNVLLRRESGLAVSGVSEVTLPAFANLYVSVFPARGPYHLDAHLLRPLSLGGGETGPRKVIKILVLLSDISFRECIATQGATKARIGGKREKTHKSVNSLCSQLLDFMVIFYESYE